MYLNLWRRWDIKLHNTLWTRRPSGISTICCWIHILAWIYRSCIVFHNALVLDGSLQYVQRVPSAAILLISLLFSIIWYCRIQSPAVWKRQEVRWCSFRWSFPLAIGYVCESIINGVISTPSWSYFILLLLLLLLQASYLRAAKVNHIRESEARFCRS